LLGVLVGVGELFGLLVGVLEVVKTLAGVLGAFNKLLQVIGVLGLACNSLDNVGVFGAIGITHSAWIKIIYIKY
jgi:hypothetical protein